MSPSVLIIHHIHVNHVHPFMYVCLLQLSRGQCILSIPLSKARSQAYVQPQETKGKQAHHILDIIIPSVLLYYKIPPMTITNIA